MLNRIVYFSLRFRGVVVALACLTIGYGCYVTAHSKLDVFPNFVPPEVVVQTEAPGLSAEQVEVAKSNIDLAQQTLDQSRDRFAAGVADTVEVVQAQEQVATANDSYISSLYSYNYAKISLARALGQAEASVKE